MTDKKTIIDGIDVSRCVSFDKLNGLNICCYSDTREDKIPFANFCVENKDCDFKQHKRKERELEPFKDDYFKNLDTKTIAELAKKSIRLTTENRKFEDALDEIEENIKAMNNECFYDDICECNNCDMKNGCTYYRKFNILNIINKAKGGVNGNT